MLWHKAWLETRWRFISALVILTMMAGSNVYDYLATHGCCRAERDDRVAGRGSERPRRRDSRSDRGTEGVPRLHLVPGVPPEPDADGRVLRGAARLRRIAAESSKGSALFTLSLPVTRKQLLGARTATGLAQLFAIAMVPPLVIPLLAPSIGQQFSVVDALAHGLCLFFVGAVFFSLASFLSTMFTDIWRPLLIAIGIACALAIASFAVPQLGIFSVMSGESYFKTGSLPWMGFLTSAVIASALLYSAAETLERRDF